MNFTKIARLMSIFFALFPLLVANGDTRALERGRLVNAGIIFSEAQTANSARQLFEILPPFWMPSVTDVSELQRQLPVYLGRSGWDERNQLLLQRILPALKSYKMQYLGYTHNGNKWIFMNAFCESHWKQDKSWIYEIVDVTDGGVCYFQVRYNVADGHFERLWINGES